MKTGRAFCDGAAAHEYEKRPGISCIVVGERSPRRRHPARAFDPARPALLILVDTRWP